jgi:hypothetical protein
MTRQNTMVFWRDTDIGPACLEYSWIPQGTRRVIRLPLGQDEGGRTDPTDSDTSQVQVYRLVCNRVGADTWQFPPGPHSSRIVYATIQVFESRKYAVGTAAFADGSSATDFRPLKDAPLPCPESPGN